MFNKLIFSNKLEFILEISLFVYLETLTIRNNVKEIGKYMQEALLLRGNIIALSVMTPSKDVIKIIA